MSLDFAALTGSIVVGQPDVRACLIVSRDGLALGAYPAECERQTLSVWFRLSGLGEVERGFVVFDGTLYAFCTRGPYGAIAMAGQGARAGLLLDTLERTLAIAEDARFKRETVGVTPAGGARTEEVRSEPTSVEAGGGGPGSADPTIVPDLVSSSGGRPPGRPPSETARNEQSLAREEASPPAPWPGPEAETETLAEPRPDPGVPEPVDMFAIAREFSGLIHEVTEE